MKNLFTDFYYFILIIIYWVFAFLILHPIKFIDRSIGTNVFNYLDKQIRKISNAD